MLLGVLVGYLIGTFPSADLVTRLVSRGAVDIRQSGSGNPGGLNTMRVLGKGWGALVMFLDTLKGVIAGFVGLAIGDAAAYAAGTAAIAGHVWPVWTRFRGGRGVATAGGSFASVFPPFFPIAAVFALVVTLIRRRPGAHDRAGLPPLGGGRRRLVGGRPAQLVGPRARRRPPRLRRARCPDGAGPLPVLGPLRRAGLTGNLPERVIQGSERGE